MGGTYSGLGGAILNDGALTIQAVTFSGNQAIGGNGGAGTNAHGGGGGGGLGGAVFSRGTMNIAQSTFTANSATGGTPGGDQGCYTSAGSCLPGVAAAAAWAETAAQRRLPATAAMAAEAALADTTAPPARVATADSRAAVARHFTARVPVANLAATPVKVGLAAAVAAAWAVRYLSKRRPGLLN